MVKNMSTILRVGEMSKAENMEVFSLPNFLQKCFCYKPVNCLGSCYICVCYVYVVYYIAPCDNKSGPTRKYLSSNSDNGSILGACPFLRINMIWLRQQYKHSCYDIKFGLESKQQAYWTFYERNKKGLVKEQSALRTINLSKPQV